MAKQNNQRYDKLKGSNFTMVRLGTSLASFLLGHSTSHVGAYIYDIKKDYDYIYVIKTPVDFRLTISN